MGRESRDGRSGRRRVSPWPYLIVGLVLAAIPLGGYGIIRWTDLHRAQAEECFRRPARDLSALASGYDGLRLSPDGRRAVAWRTTRNENSMEFRISRLNLESGEEIEVFSKNITTIIAKLSFANFVKAKSAPPALPPGPVAVSDALPFSGGRVLLVDTVDTSEQFYMPRGSLPIRSARHRLYVWGSEQKEGAEPRLLATTGAFLLPPFGPPFTPRLAVTLSPDGSRALFAEQDGSLHLWNLDGDRELRALQLSPGSPRRPIVAVAFSPDGARALAVERDGTARLWSPEAGREIRTFPPPDLPAQGLRSAAVAFSRDGSRALVADSALRSEGALTASVRLCDLESGETLRTLASVDGEIFSLALSPDGRRAAGGGYTWRSDRPQRAAAWLWDLRSGKLIRRFGFPPREEGSASAVEQVLFSPGGREVVAAGWRTEITADGTSGSPTLIGSGGFISAGAVRSEAELLRWRLPDELGFRLLGAEEEPAD